MKRIIILAVFLLLPSLAVAGHIDFESGTDGQTVYREYPGVEFSPNGGNYWLYADWSTGAYDGPYPDGAYFSEGSFFAWMGVPQGMGDIVFTERTATYVTIGYAAQYQLTVEAFDSSMNLLDTRTGDANLCSGALDTITVTGADIAVVRIKEGSELGNYWLIDEIVTDGISFCTVNEHCDDGIFCNGEETCISQECVPGTDPCPDDGTFCNGTESCDETGSGCLHSGDPCPDDGLFCNGSLSCDEETDACSTSDEPCSDDTIFCNGSETCNEDSDSCDHSGDPCSSGEECMEDTDSCRTPDPEPDDDEDDDDDDEDDEVWPKGGVSGGSDNCCGC